MNRPYLKWILALTIFVFAGSAVLFFVIFDSSDSSDSSDEGEDCASMGILSFKVTDIFDSSDEDDYYASIGYGIEFEVTDIFDSSDDEGEYYASIGYNIELEAADIILLDFSLATTIWHLMQSYPRPVTKESGGDDYLCSFTAEDVNMLLPFLNWSNGATAVFWANGTLDDLMIFIETEQVTGNIVVNSLHRTHHAWGFDDVRITDVHGVDVSAFIVMTPSVFVQAGFTVNDRPYHISLSLSDASEAKDMLSYIVSAIILSGGIDEDVLHSLFVLKAEEW